MASADQSDPPRLLIIAGPNGSGKSSLYADAGLSAFGLSVWIINPDLLSARIAAVEQRPLEAANVEAVRLIDNSGAEPKLLATRHADDQSSKEDLREIIDRLQR